MFPIHFHLKCGGLKYPKQTGTGTGFLRSSRQDFKSPNYSVHSCDLLSGGLQKNEMTESLFQSR